MFRVKTCSHFWSFTTTGVTGGFSSVAKRSCMALASNACMVVFGFPDENTICGIIEQLFLESLYESQVYTYFPHAA